MKKPWFFTSGMPITWEGWVVAIAYGLWVLYQVKLFFILAGTEGSVLSPTSLILKLGIPTILVFVIVWYKSRLVFDKDIIKAYKPDTFQGFLGNIILRLFLPVAILALILYFMF
jgi:hypothetical protein